MNMKRFAQVLVCLGILAAAGCSDMEGTTAQGTGNQETFVESVQGTAEDYSTRSVEACDLSGDREPNAVVDIGYGDREYWAYTNEYGQLVKVTAEQIILQDEKTESTVNHRYCTDEARVRGTEKKEYDQGHIIADSLGGVSNAYNITPQDAYLNRHGDQAYMEKVIRDAGGCTDFVAEITYPDTTTQIPSHYSYTYTIHGNVVHDSYDNVDPRTTLSQDTTVYVSRSGSTYHKDPHCSGMKNPISMDISDAKEKELKPCTKCWE